MNNKKFIITIIILAVIVAAVSFFAVNEARKNKEMSQLFAVEKQEMENEYSTFATQYDELQIQINNDSLREKLESEKLKTQRLLEELRQVKTSDAAEIMRLKKELKTVRAVLRSYVMQIDSLNKINAALMQENQEVKSKYSAATAQISNLSQETKSLNEIAIFLIFFTRSVSRPLLFSVCTRMLVASSWAASDTFSFRLFVSCDKLEICAVAALYLLFTS